MGEISSSDSLSESHQLRFTDSSAHCCNSLCSEIQQSKYVMYLKRKQGNKYLRKEKIGYQTSLHISGPIASEC